MGSKAEAVAVKAAFLKALEGYHLHRRMHRLSVNWISHGYSVGYAARTHASTPPIAQFDVNVLGDVFYLLFVRIDPRFRGRGFGSDLYERLEEVAARLGCREIRMTPSGVTPKNETRRDYLLRRGYCLDGNEVYKELGDG